MSRVSVNSYARTNFGTRELEDLVPGKYKGESGTQKLEVVFSYDDLPTYSTDQQNLVIPANSFIESAHLRVITAFAGGTSYDIGLYESDSTVIDADGIDAAVATAAINAVGETVICDGALVGGLAGTGTADGQIVVAATGTFTAGKAVLTIKYRELIDRT